MYLVAVVDWYNRRVLSFKISATLDTVFCMDAVEEKPHNVIVSPRSSTPARLPIHQLDALEQRGTSISPDSTVPMRGTASTRVVAPLHQTMHTMEDIKEGIEKELPLYRWVSYRFGLIATRLGALHESAYRGKHKLSKSTWRALAVVANFEPLSASMLSERTRLDPPKVSRAINALVQRELVTREENSTDRRRVVLRLTAKGRKTYRDIEPTVVCLEREITALLTAAEMKALRSALDKIDAQIARHRNRR